MAGKGDRPRPTDLTRYREGWERAFGSDILVRANRPGEPRAEVAGPLKGCYVAHVDAQPARHHDQYGRAWLCDVAQPVRLPGDRHGS